MPFIFILSLVKGILKTFFLVTYSKKKIFVDILKKKLIRFSTLENEKIDEFKNNRKENNSKNIPKVPNKEKYTNNSEKVKKHERKLNEIKIQNFNDNKTKYTLFNKFSRLKSCDLNNLNHINLNIRKYVIFLNYYIN